MSEGTLAAALEREHQEIDAGIESYRAGRDTAALSAAVRALRRHIYLEEEFLFPPLRAAGLMPPVLVMLREHGEMWPVLDAVDAELGGAADRASLDALCADLVPRLEAHNAKEEAILYSRADAVLDTAPTGAELKAAIRSDDMPEGWVCERAGGASSGGRSPG
jgi:hypothetical protein